MWNKKGGLLNDKEMGNMLRINNLKKNQKFWKRKAQITNNNKMLKLERHI